MRNFLISFSLVLAIVLACASADVSAQNITRAWTTRLPASTRLNTSVSTWNDPQAASFTFQGRAYLGVTTADGALHLLDAAGGQRLWTRGAWTHGSVGQWQNRSSAGNSFGLFVMQAGRVLSLSVANGSTIFDRPSPLTAGQMYLYGGQILLSDAGRIVSIDARAGHVVWSVGNVQGTSYRVDGVGMSGRVAYYAMDPVKQTVRVEARDATGRVRLTWNAPWGAGDFYLATVDSTTVTGLWLASTRVCRFPSWCTRASMSGVNGLTGYSLSCPQGGQRCGGAKGYSSFFLNTANRTHSFDFASGKQLGVSVPHSSGHLVGLAKIVTVSGGICDQGTETRVFAYDTMVNTYNVTVIHVDPYNIRANWYNEIVYPQTGGFTFLFGATGQVVRDYQSAHPDGIVLHNLIVEQQSVYLTSGRDVVKYKFASA